MSESKENLLNLFQNAYILQNLCVADATHTQHLFLFFIFETEVIQKTVKGN